MGMKLKSGADLCGFELSRFCVQNDVAIPDAPASGRKYFHTGTGMEGKYSLLGRERIFTGTAWRAAAYVDDLANLDITSNADYLALKEKVDLLSGEVDTDAIINNMKDVENFLAGFNESGGTLMSYLNTELGKKLDKTEGTAVGYEVPLTVKSTRADGAYCSILFYNNDNRQIASVGFANGVSYLSNELSGGKRIGVTNDGTPVYKTGYATADTEYTLIHSGNIGEYALPLTGGLMKDAATIQWENNKCSWDNVVNGFIGISNASEENSLGYYAGLSFRGYYGLQLRTFGGRSSNLEFRGFDAANWGDWKTIAFTDSTVAAAQKLVTDNGGDLVHFASNTLFVGDTIYPNYQTHILGYDVILRSGASATQGLILNSSGNVGIGLTNPSARLHVSQDIVANGTIACKGVAAEGSAPVGTVDKWAGSIATGTKTQTYTHGLGTTDITVAIYEKNGNEWVQILTDVDIVNANSIRVTFGSNTTVEHRIIVMG